MSLTNEQRAHDLTICAIQYMLKDNVIPTDSRSNEDNGTITIKKDIFKLYVDTYKLALNAMNREFKE